MHLIGLPSLVRRRCRVDHVSAPDASYLFTRIRVMSFIMAIRDIEVNGIFWFNGLFGYRGFLSYWVTEAVVAARFIGLIGVAVVVRIIKLDQLWRRCRVVRVLEPTHHESITASTALLCVLI